MLIKLLVIYVNLCLLTYSKVNVHFKVLDKLFYCDYVANYLVVPSNVGTDHLTFRNATSGPDILKLSIKSVS